MKTRAPVLPRCCAWRQIYGSLASTVTKIATWHMTLSTGARAPQEGDTIVSVGIYAIILAWARLVFISGQQFSLYLDIATVF